MVFISNENFKLVFDNIILKQLKKLGKDKNIKEIISKMLDKIQENGPNAGKLLDSRLALYEVKTKRPPLRLYYKIVETTEAYVFEYKMKTSNEKQHKTIEKIKQKIRLKP